jgi:2-methylcitrate dehydratase PrpD
MLCSGAIAGSPLEIPPVNKPGKTSSMASRQGSTRELAAFASDIRYTDLPEPVVRKAKALFLDWCGSALAGRLNTPIKAIEAFADAMGPQTGFSERLTSRRWTSPYFAALVNGAASHMVEQDDVHNGSVFHPAAVIFPSVLATAQARSLSGREFIAASVAGYEAGIRVGEFLGRSHYRVFHTTGTAGCVASAAAVGRLMRLDPVKLNHALGSAGTQAAGLWEFLRDAADSKQLHTAKAAADGLLAADLAERGFTGATAILEGPQGLAAGTSSDADSAKLVADLGTRWAILETSLKWHASCRHTHPAADVLQSLMRREKIAADSIRHVTAHVHQAAIDVLGPVTDAKTIHQAKFSMGMVLGLVAVHGDASLGSFERFALQDPRVRQFCDRVEMVYDPEVDRAYPARWLGRVEVDLQDGRRLAGQVDEPKGDPGNWLTREEIEGKALQLAAFADGARADEMRTLIDRIWRLEEIDDFPGLLSTRPPACA